MKTSKWRPTLLLPPEAENQLQVLAAKLGVSLQEMMRDAVMSLLRPQSMPLSKKDEDVLAFLGDITLNSPKIAESIRDLIAKCAEEYTAHGHSTLDERIETELGKAQRIVGAPARSTRRNKATRGA